MTIIAAGLPLLTETTRTQQVDGWNLVRPHTCVFFSNSPPTLTIYQANSSFAVYLVDSLATSTLLKMCNDGSPFYAFWDSRSGPKLRPLRSCNDGVVLSLTLSFGLGCPFGAVAPPEMPTGALASR
jgi:hypothetical protein